MSIPYIILALIYLLFATGLDDNKKYGAYALAALSYGYLGLMEN